MVSNYNKVPPALASVKLNHNHEVWDIYIF